MEETNTNELITEVYEMYEILLKESYTKLTIQKLSTGYGFFELSFEGDHLWRLRDDKPLSKGTTVEAAAIDFLVTYSNKLLQKKENMEKEVAKMSKCLDKHNYNPCSEKRYNTNGIIEDFTKLKM